MKTAAALLCLLVPAAAFAATPVKPAASKPAAAKHAASGSSAEKDKTLYVLGYYLGSKLQPFSLSAAEAKRVEAGLNDSVLGKPAQADVNTYGPKINELLMERQAKKAEARKQTDKAFLSKQAKLPGAQVEKSGLIYFDVRVGTGAHPTAEDTVKCNYEGTLPDGTVFDSSYKRGEPTDFPLRGVIPCWTEGIQKMKVGGKAKLVCPSDIAYGDEGHPPQIPPGATLVFNVELLDIVKK